jgi:hypothetical protein
MPDKWHHLFRGEFGDFLQMFRGQHFSRRSATVFQGIFGGSLGFVSYSPIVIALQCRWCDFCKNAFDSTSGYPLIVV